MILEISNWIRIKIFCIKINFFMWSTTLTKQQQGNIFWWLQRNITGLRGMSLMKLILIKWSQSGWRFCKIYNNKNGVRKINKLSRNKWEKRIIVLSRISIGLVFTYLHITVSIMCIYTDFSYLLRNGNMTRCCMAG